MPKPDLINVPTVCRECGESCLVWHADLHNTSGVVQGRLRTTDLRPIFYLGCECCSETIMVVGADQIAAAVNEMREAEVILPLRKDR